MYNVGLFALSGDPIHYGHQDIIVKALQSCNKLYVLISENDDKAGKYFFTLEERVQIAKRFLSTFDKVEVIIPGPNKVLSDIYLKYGCDVLFRGVRNNKDIEYETNALAIHNSIHPMNVRFIWSSESTLKISSSLVKTLASHHLDLKYVPCFIKQAIEEKNSIYKFGVTGQMATGKSTIAKKLSYLLSGRYHDIYQHAAIQYVVSHIAIDDLVKRFWESNDPGCVKAKANIYEKLSEVGGKDLTDSAGNVNKQNVASLVFQFPEIKQFVETTTAPFINLMYRDELASLSVKIKRCENTKGIVIFDWAQLAEMNMGRWVNHNVVIVDSPDQNLMAEKRSITSEELNKRLKHQLSADEKEKKIKDDASVEESNIIRYTNRFIENKDQAASCLLDLDQLAKQVRTTFFGGLQ